MQKLQRQSNFELLRILSMFMVLALHANYLSNGMPNHSDIVTSPIDSSFRVISHAFCAVAVNVFICISGWFGLKFNRRNLCNILFQCLFYSIVIIVFFCFFDSSKLSLKFFSTEIFVGGGYWFIPPYIILMVISPVLNTYVEYASRDVQKGVLVVYFFFQFYYGWVRTDGLFQNGFSTLSFIGLYLLVRYIRTFSPRIAQFKDARIYFCIYLCSCLVVGCVFISVLLLNNDNIARMAEQRFILSYNNPLIIIASLSLLLAFSKLKFIGINKCVNWLAQSCFAIYLIHDHPLVWKYYVNHMHQIHITYNGFLASALILISILFVGIACILLDKVRLFVWEKISNSCSFIK